MASTTLTSVYDVLFKERKFYIDNPYELSEVLGVVRSHASISQSYRILDKYYKGEHVILHRSFDDNNKPNNRLVHNFPKIITDNATSYFIGKPISYTGNDKPFLEKYQETLDRNNSHSVETELAKMTSKFGHAFEVCWMDDKANFRFKAVSPQNMIMCYSMDIDEKPLCAIHYKTYVDEITHETRYRITVYTDKEVYKFTGNLLDNVDLEVYESKVHYFGAVPVTEYIANEERIGDYEVVLSLIDAYNICCSDSVNDINYLNDAYLMLKNLISTEEDDINDMKNNRVMLVDGDGDAQWLVKNINDLHIENIKKRLVEDIHKFAMTPNISDEKFASNLSGVAISYKLNSLESKTAVKEQYFSIALRNRVQLYANVLEKEGVSCDVELIFPTFTRNIPQNLMELVQTVLQLQNVVPNEELLSLLPFIDDVDDALDKLDKEREKNMELNYGAFELDGDSNVQQGNKQAGKESKEDL